MRKKILTLFFITGTMFFLVSCEISFIDNKKEVCPIDNLLLEYSDYPSRTEFDIPQKPVDEEPKSSIARSAYFKNSWIGEFYAKYYSAERSEKVYLNRAKSIFDPDEVYGDWEYIEINPNDYSAQQLEIGCGNVKNFGERCIMIGQYEDYLVILNVDIRDPGISKSMFQKLTILINNNINKCILKNSSTIIINV